MFISSRCTGRGRPGQTDDQGFPFLGFLTLLLILLCAVGGGGGLLLWKRMQFQQMVALEAEMEARSAAEMARAEAERFQAEKLAQLQRDGGKNLNGVDPAQNMGLRLIAEKARGLCEQGKVSEGLLWWARGLEVCQGNPVWEPYFRVELASWGKTAPAWQNILTQLGGITVLAAPPGKLLVGHEKGALSLYDRETKQPLGPTRSLGEAGLAVLAIPPQGNRVLVADTTSHWQTVDLTGDEIKGEPEEAPGQVLCLGFDADGATRVLGTCERGLWLATGAGGPAALRKIPRTSPVVAASFFRKTTGLIALHEDGRLRQWNLADEEPMGASMIPRVPPTHMEVSPNGIHLATSEGKTVQLWSLSTGLPWGRPLELPAPIRALAFSAEGNMLYGATSVGSIFSWPIPEGISGEVSRLTLWAQVGASAELTPEGALVPLNPKERDLRREHLTAKGGPPVP